MPRPTRKKKKKKEKPNGGGATPDRPTPPEEYLPGASEITEVKQLVSPRGKRYTVLVSTELDPYDDDPEGDEKKP